MIPAHEIEEAPERAAFKPETFRRLMGAIAGYPRVLWGAVALLLLGTAAALSEPRIFGHAIDTAIVPHDRVRLHQIGLIFLGVEIIRVSCMIAHGYLFELLGQKVMQELRIRLLSHLQILPVSDYDRNPVGRLVTRVTNDVAAMAEMFSAGFVAMAGNALMVVGILGWLLFLDLRLGLIAASLFPLLIVFSVHFSRKLRTAYRLSRSRLSVMNAFLAENILGMRVILLFNRQKRHRERFERINDSYSDAQMGSVRVFAYFQPAITWCSGFSMALLVWYGGIAAYDGTIKLGILVTFFTYVLSLFQPVREIADKWSVFLSGMTAAERVFQILDWKPEMPAGETGHAALALPAVKGRIVFENVWFAYEDERWVLRDFSLTIEPGSKVGIVGHTGAGKTTIISLLMRFYEPQRGRILLDGVDIRTIDRRRLRATIGIIQQDVFLFSGSIEDNIALWRPLGERARGAVSRALRSLGFPAWISESADASGASAGKADLQERGTNLSMGERQVMAYARALASDPAVWVLDEATSNIDSATEARLEKSLGEASRSRTSILIAHRLATVRDADQIIVLHKGVMVENGDHRALMAKDGLYARLYRYQSSAPEAVT